MGIFLNISLTIFKTFLPKKETDKPPTKVIIIIDNNISIPGIENGRYEFGLISFGIKFEEMDTKNTVKYNVKPIGTSTRIPAIK